jgi:hypothetical protein
MKRNKVGDVLIHNKLGRDRWVVVATVMTGGGTGHGPHDIYPDGHRLTLRRLLPGTDNIDWATPEEEFYQSGSFVEKVMLNDPIALYNLEKRTKG